MQEVNVSSTKIRQSLLNGEIERTNEFSGRSFQCRGVVVEGQKIGRTIGFPTANIDLNNQHKILPKDGVYAVRAEINGIFYNGMMNIGFNPTVLSKESTEKKIEVHLFDFDADIYGEHMAVFLYRYIRNEKTFSNLEALKSQLKYDSKEVRNFFNLHRK